MQATAKWEATAAEIRVKNPTGRAGAGEGWGRIAGYLDLADDAEAALASEHHKDLQVAVTVLRKTNS